MPRGVPQARFSGKTPICPARRHVRLRILPEPAKVINYKHGTCRRDCRTAAFSITPSADFAMTDDIWLRALLRNAKDIAILGAKDKPGQPVDGVGRYIPRAPRSGGLRPTRTWQPCPSPSILLMFSARRSIARSTRAKCWPCPGGPKFSGCSQALSRPKRGNCLRRRAWPWWKTPA